MQNMLPPGAGYVILHQMYPKTDKSFRYSNYPPRGIGLLFLNSFLYFLYLIHYLHLSEISINALLF